MHVELNNNYVLGIVPKLSVKEGKSSVEYTHLKFARIKEKKGKKFLIVYRDEQGKKIKPVKFDEESEEYRRIVGSNSEQIEN